MDIQRRLCIPSAFWPEPAVATIEAAAGAPGQDVESLTRAAWALVLSRHLRERSVRFEVVTSRGPHQAHSDVVDAQVDPDLPFTELVRSLRVTPLAAASGEECASSLRIGDAGGFSLGLELDARQFGAWAGERMLEQTLRCLETVARNPAIRTADIDLVTEAERHRLLEDWNPPALRWRSEATIPELFADQVAARPEAVAVRHSDSVLTYAELDFRANRLARRLRSLGVGRDVPVGICLERTPEMVVAVLAILKAGGGYLPLEPTFPQSRLRFMLEDAGARVVITQASMRDRLPERVAQMVLVDDDAAVIAAEAAAPLEVAVGAGDLAYINYTSGSTGVPKGVEIPHRAVNRLVCHVDYAQLDAGRTILHASTLAFDASTFEIWGALLNGGCVALHHEGIPTPRGLAASINAHGVTTLWLTTSLFNAIVEDEPARLVGVAEILVGGEALSVDHIRQAQSALPGVQFVNGFGPTETTTFACCHRIPHALPGDVSSIPIGTPIRDTRAYVLDQDLRLAAMGALGELFIGGDGVARGYLNRPELTAQRFLADPFGPPGSRMYRTGDLVRWNADGTLHFVGRADNQVKIRGFRVETGEIETVLGSHPAVRSCAVVPRDLPGGKRLVAYLAGAGDEAPTNGVLRAFIASRLPEYMIPTAFVWLPELPVNANGKLDRRALPVPYDRPELEAEYAAPSRALEHSLAAIWSDVIGITRIGIDDPFFDLGGDSIRVLRVVSRLRTELGLEVPVARLFEHVTIRELARNLERQAVPPVTQPALARLPARRDRDAIAIVGMAGRFPGAGTVEELWTNLVNGVDGTTFFDDAELDSTIPDALRRDPHYVSARGILRDVESFDAGFFGINPAEAALIDPQQRLLMEVSWEALERSGHVPDSFPGDIGIFAGKYNDSYFANNVRTRPDLLEKVGDLTAMVGHEKDYVATSIAHKLDLTGPALSIHTACSTSLVAVCLAIESLRRGECDLALAGGVSVTVPVRSGYLHQEGTMLSADGRTRTFDSRATGTTFSDGVAMVVLRRLEDAVAGGDTIYAVIRGGAINNDGGRKASFTAPSVKGQATVIARAQADAGVDARSISYVEAHGTATPLGDPIEIEALTQAFSQGTSDRGFCAIGSVKSNVGHLTIAAGAAGLIKTALSLHHEVIPATINFESPNPAIDFAVTPFYVASSPVAWPRGEAPRRAGVSSFGVGGTNAHVILEEAPSPIASTAIEEPQLIVMSARSVETLGAAGRRLADDLRHRPELEMADVAYTLQAGRRAFGFRGALVASSLGEAAARLAGGDSRVRMHHVTGAPALAFMFPGQGVQEPGMARGLYEKRLVFRTAVDHCAAILGDHGSEIRDLIVVAGGEEAAATLRRTAAAQPAIFIFSYALAQLWMEAGVAPEAVVGHSVGEYVGAVLAGVMSLEDGLRLVAERGRLMQPLPSGSMLAVTLHGPELAERLRTRPGLSLAAENAPGLNVVAGPAADVEELRAELEAAGMTCRLLATSHAFHSAMVEPALAPFADLVAGVALQAPKLPIVSTVTGDWMSAEEATDPGYWTRQMRETVRFSDAVRTLLADPERLLLELGPRATLAPLAQRQVRDHSRQAAVASQADQEAGGLGSFLDAAGQLWIRGLAIDWVGLRGGRAGRRLVLPTYPFERRRHWIDPVTAAAVPTSVPAAPTATPALEAIPIPEEIMTSSPTTFAAAGTSVRIKSLVALLEDITGLELAGVSPETSFLEIGLDSLSLTQVAIQIQRQFALKITFRQLMEAFPNLRALAEHLDAQLPPAPNGAPATAAVAPPAQAALAPAAPAAAAPALPQTTVDGSPAERLIAEQLKIMAQQLAVLSGASALAAANSASGAAANPVTAATEDVSVSVNGSGEHASEPTGPVEYDHKKPFGAIARINLGSDELLPMQRARLEAFIRRYTARTQESKRLAQAHRAHLADPRMVTGFRPAIKELVYQVSVVRSEGSRVWDVDGNEYVDVLNGFGASLFGWQPKFVTDAVSEQLARGYEIGPMHPLAGEVAEMVCKLTGFDRAGFCNTGSEAVLGAIRIARTVTGRSPIAIFTGSYHGIFDEVVVRGTKKLRAVPAAPGILPSSAENVVVLDYGTPESLEVLRARSGELAAIVVEPVQSRHPDFQPAEFLRELRKITKASGTALIMDEMVTGFRVAPGGAQELFGVVGDLATYGKAVGGGFPIGIIAGRREWMDALDGGHWQYGDDSTPTVGVTYFAGTFVRHPLALVATRAVLQRLLDHSPGLQRQLNQTTEQFVTGLNAHFREVGALIEIQHFGSLWKPFFTGEHPHGDLLAYMLRDRGVHILEGFPCFFTTAHSQADVDHVTKAMRESVSELQEAGFLPERPRSANGTSGGRPPAPGARLGRDESGNPAWFMPNPEQPGKFILVAKP